jgi:formylglycine-generating enzyme required for sulfatase activity
LASPKIFVSYSRHDRPWVEAFVADLTRVLEAEGVHKAVFWDKDLESGWSWVAQLQAQGHDATVFVLVATPWALASFWVMQRELDTALTDSSKRLAVVTPRERPPLPPWLESSQTFDFRAPETYSRGLEGLVEFALGRPPGAGGVAMPSLSPPAPLVSPWPTELSRDRAISALAPLFRTKARWSLAAEALGIQRDSLRFLTTPELRTSAALVHKAKPETELAAASHALEVIADAFSDDEDLQARVSDCLRLAKEIRALTASPAASAVSPLDAYFEHLRRHWLGLSAPSGESRHAYIRQRVYVPLAVKGHDSGSLPQDSAAGDLLRVLRRGRTEGWNAEDCWVLLGDPGTGKTTLLWHLAKQLVDLGAAAEWVPVFASLSSLVPEDVDKAPADPIRRAATTLGLEVAPQVEEALRRLPGNRRLLLLLDGLDEVRDTHRAKEVILGLCTQWRGRATVLVSSRYVPYERPGENFGELALQPFGPDEWRDFLTKWREENPNPRRSWDVEAQIEAISMSRSLSELAKVPLLLMLLAGELDARGKLEDTNRTLLYERFFQYTLEGLHRSNRARRRVVAIHEVLAVLRGLALSFTRANLDQEAEEPLCERLHTHSDLRDAWATLQQRAGAHYSDPTAFLETVSHCSGVLRLDSDHQLWGFGHRSYREALTGLALSKLPERELLDFAHRPKHDPSAWAESVAMAVAKATEPDPIVLALSKGPYPALAYRALAVASHLQSGTVRAVLDLPSNGLEKRFAAIRAIPGLVGDREAATRLLVGLIDDAREAGRPYADDLYFVYETLRALEKGSETDSVAQQRQAMFHRLPTPEPALFERIYSRHLRREVALQAPVASGRFLMGSPPEEGGDEDEHPQHWVHITRLRAAMVVPVTNAMFVAFDSAFEPYSFGAVKPAELGGHPAVNISWYAAAAFCLWLRHKLPAWRGARLPSEAEWEFLARAGTCTAYWNGDNDQHLEEVGWFDGNSESRTHRVAEKAPNKWGLFDVHGNVWEWCRDWSQRQYSPEEVTDPAGPPSGLSRVVRGGSWGGSAGWCRAAYRVSWYPWVRGQVQGFRVVVSAAPELDPRS